MQPPKPRAGPVFIDRLHVPMPLTGPLRGANDFGQKRLGRGIPVQDTVFPALFVIHNELNRDLGPIRPFRIGGRGPISQHVPLIPCHLNPHLFVCL